MTASQIRSIVGGAIAFIGGVTTSITPYVGLIPEKYKTGVQIALGIIAAVGVGLTMLNQSLSPGHYSIPQEQANNLIARAPEAVKAAAPALAKQIEKQ
jgi:hypothetical protein